ncbi:MAG: putative CXXCH cytochrome family protein [Phycisphaerales bacterium]|jgi:predicted CXXCH cytochrome family protein
MSITPDNHHAAEIVRRRGLLLGTLLTLGYLASGLALGRAGLAPDPSSGLSSGPDADRQPTVESESTPHPHTGLEQILTPPGTAFDGQSCTAVGCHSEKTDHEFTHGPLYVSACNICHVVADRETLRVGLARPVNQLCVFCHEQDTPTQTTVHAPFRAGACVQCHSPHGGEDPRLLRKDHYGELCLSCHESMAEARDLVHGPVADGACSACHQPHTSPNRKLLIEDGQSLCLSCHADLGNRIETALVVHPPVQTDCQLCHDPHATDNPAMLLQDASTLCMSCHEEVRHTVDDATTPHGAVTSERSCLSCHSPHTSDHQRLLRNNAASLCFECHDKVIEREDGTTLANMKEIVETRANLHTPVAQGDCTLCHEIHGGSRERLLVREYPSTIYAPFGESQYALCFGCHDQTMVTDQKTTTVTRFRNGDTNLHFVHVNDDKKGRTCAVCHDTHASNHAKHIREAVPYGPGGWELPIGFQQTLEGGTCAAGCHQPHEYNRSDPVNYPPAPPPAPEAND